MVAVGTGTIELVNSLVDQVGPAGTSVLAGIALTSGQLYRTILASIFGLTRTKIVGPAVGANPVFAGIVSLALVDFVLAVITLVALVAFASVAADAIHADTRLAGVAVALVDVYLAILAGDTLYTQALVPAIISTIDFTMLRESSIYTYGIL